MVDRIRRFQVLNSQIFGVLARHLAADEERAGVEHPLKRMVDRIRRFQVLNSQIFGVLARHLAADEERAGVEHVRCFPPPAAPMHAIN
ncbi:hypothetical protein PYW07_012571 [Mythimna separata]|uniref:Uncharacterized protein n=1 Tax=Mythimna separata TaxID=271217 RepID=A0AAD8DLI4_MYTSE|nr:hypothetical protein PYW07_012571 [Mythimna separata]